MRENMQKLTKNFSSGVLDPTSFASRSAAMAKNSNYLKTVNVSPNRGGHGSELLTNQISPLIYSQQATPCRTNGKDT